MGFCGAVLVVVLAFEGITTHTIGPSAEPSAAATHGKAPLAGANPVMQAQGDRLKPSNTPPGRRIALTFDDGPDARWTPRIAAVLKRFGVHGTFFVIGSQASRNPSVIRDLVRDGNVLGNHTFTHTALTNSPSAPRRCSSVSLRASSRG
jgi:peptidoglycan/xylan/chitin deacetylase (PgdA/CDA1 family)